MSTGFFDSSIGRLYFTEKDGFIVSLSFSGDDFEHGSSVLTKKVKSQLSEYFSGERHSFDLPISPKGTEFQKAVWNVLCEIPYGETRTYGEIAAAIGKPKSARAVGFACNKNPIAILIPCHRVIGKSKNLIGYAAGIDTKAALLNLEKAKYAII